MLRIVRFLTRLIELLIAAPVRAVRSFFSMFVFNPRLGRFRIVTGLAAGYVIFGLILVYPFAFFWGLAGQAWIGDVLDYANERSLGTAIYDARGRFVGTFDPALDSEADFNYTGKPIELPGYIAYPDHKSLHVSAIPEHYWACLAYHEDRHIRTVLNPWGIDLLGYLKIPVSTLKRSIEAGRPRLGAGGSTISMQLARIFFKTPPSAEESVAEKIGRKFKEWWLAPVIQRQLTRGRDLTPLKRWAANHFPLAQRTGGDSLYGVEQAGLILFGKPASALTRAEQYVLAAAVNQPIILLEGNDRLNRYRMASWRRVAGGRARICADALIADPAKREVVTKALVQMAESPPDPRTPPEIAETLAEFAPSAARTASANPVRRSNALIPAAKYGVRDQIRNAYGFGWRSHVRGVHLTLDVTENLAFRTRVLDALARLQARYRARINPHYSLDPEDARGGDADAPLIPDIVIAAADETGAIVRYFESNYTAAYFGAALGRDPETGKYDKDRESRFIASIAKMAAAVAIANDGTDTPDTKYLDVAAPASGLEACRKGHERRLRRADVAFACSLNTPIEWRMRQLGSARLRRIVDGFSLTVPKGGPGLAKGLAVGQIAASPRTVHRMAGTVLAALAEGEEQGETQGQERAPAPSLLHRIDHTERSDKAGQTALSAGGRQANPVRPEGRALLGALLSAPLCYRYGTLRRVSDWCADNRAGVRLHFAKTGTRGTGAAAAEADDTVDLWVAGGIRFETGAAFSYVILIGTGNPSRPWARDLYAGAVTEPLHRALLEDLEKLAERKGRTTFRRRDPTPAATVREARNR